jgi:hypothetical protein
MGSINGLKNIQATSIQNAGQFYLGNNLDSGTAGQVIISGGSQQAAIWGSNSATLPGALTMGTNLSLASGNSSFDGTTADTINASGLSITGGNGISVVGGTEIVTDNDNITINNTGGTGQKNQVLKVPNALTSGTGIGFSAGTTYDGSAAITINSTATDTTYQGSATIDIDTSTTPDTINALKVPNTLTFTGYDTGTFDGSSALSINLTDTDTTYTVANPITLSAGNEIGLEIDGNTIFLDGAELAVAKVPNVITAGTNISMVNTNDGASASSYDGSEPITINAASSGTTYQGGTNISIDTSTTPDSINLDTSIAGQTGITFLNNGSSTNLTGSNYPNTPTIATNLDLSSATNIISPYFFHDVYDPSSTTGQSLTTSYVQIFSGNLKNTFTAKATSCCIEIIVMSYTVSSNRWLYLQLADNKGTEWSKGSYSDGGGTGTGTRDTNRLVHYPDETDRQIVTQTWYLQGLTIGNTYTINPQAKTSSTTNQLWTGGIWSACICRGYYLPS